MEHPLGKIWGYVNQGKSLNMRDRLFRMMCLVVAFLCLFVVIPTNLFVPGMPVLINVLAGGYGLFSVLCFWEAQRGRAHEILFVVAMALVVTCIWFLNGGMAGSVNFYFFAVVVLPLVFFEGWLRWLFVAVILVDFSGINLVGYYYPGLVTPFPSHMAAIIDVVTGSVAAYTTVVVVIWVVISNYDQEQTRLVQSAKELAASEEKFSKAFQSSPHGVALSDMQSGRFIEVNSSFCRLSGHSPAEMIGHTSLEMGLWRNEAERNQLLQPLLDSGSVHEVELRNPVHDGDPQIILYSAEVMELGSRRCIISIIQDVTERKQAEEALRFTSRRLKFIAQMSAAVLGNQTTLDLAQRLTSQVKEVFEVDACVISVLENDQFSLLATSGMPLSHQAPSLPISGLSEILLSTRAPVVIPNVRQHPLTIHLAKPSPNEFAFEAFAGVPLIVEEKVVGMLSVYLTAPRQVFTPVDVEHLQIVANHAAVSLANERHFKIVQEHKDQLETLIAEREQAETRRKSVEQALRESEERLRQSQKLEAIGQLAGGVAHDFNNILAALLLQTEFVGMVDSLPEQAREGLQEIEANTRRAADLTRQLLLFSRRQVMQTRLLDLNAIVSNLTKMLQRIIRENVQLQLQFHPGPLRIQADAGMMDQVLMNLVVNARDAMPDGGQLHIETAESIVDETSASLNPEAVPGRYVRLSVRDTGGGIPPEILSRIFEPFFTTKAEGLGTGLGLATVFGIVKQHRGWIQVDNRPGTGVEFQIFFPAIITSATTMSSAPLIARPEPCGGTECILLVEDDTVVRKSTCRLLKHYGYQVLEADNGLMALRLFNEHRFAISMLLTDLMLPGSLGGLELARRLKSEQPDIKVVFVSGYSSDIAGRDFQLRERESFLQKPFATRELLDTIRRSLDGEANDL